MNTHIVAKALNRYAEELTRDSRRRTNGGEALADYRKHLRIEAREARTLAIQVASARPFTPTRSAQVNIDGHVVTLSAYTDDDGRPFVTLASDSNLVGAEPGRYYIEHAEHAPEARNR